MRLTTTIVIGSLFAFVSPQAPPRALATVDGKVVDSITNEPVAGALVWVVGDRNAVANTDGSGRFSLSVTSGDLGLMVNKAGYGKNVNLEAPAAALPITIAANSALHNLVIPLVPLSVINGRVIDELGRPVRGADITVLRFEYVDGKRKLVHVPPSNVLTDDLGQFRFFWLDPGQYYLAVDADRESRQAAIRTPAHIPADSEATYLTTYYPGTADIGDAASITLPPGDSWLKDIALVAARTPVIQGRVLLPAGAGPGQMANVRLWPAANLLHAPAYQVLLGKGGDSAAFEIRGASQGKYWLAASFGLNGQSYSGKVEVDIDRANVAVEIPLQPAVSVHGKLTSLPAAVAPTIRLVGSTGASGNWIGKVGANGSFLIERVPLGSYRVQVIGIGRDSYLVSGKYGDQEALSNGFDVRSTPADLIVQVNGSGEQIRGSVVDSKQAAQARATVALVPEDGLRTRLDLYRSTVSGEDGTFELRGIAPGKYKLFAFEGIIPGAYTDPEFIRTVESRGKLVEIRPGTPAEMTIEWIPSGADKKGGR